MMPLYNRILSTRVAPVSGLGAFGLSGSFQQEQAIRDEYNAMAGHVQSMVDSGSMPSVLHTLMEVYLIRARSVIARGAKEADKQEIIAKIAEWEAMLVEQAAAERAAVARIVAEEQAEALRVEALIVQQAEAEAKIAAAETAAAKAAAARAAAARSVAESAAAAAAAVIPVSHPETPSYSEAPSYPEPAKAGFLDNPLMLVAIAGALVFLLKK